MTGLVLGGLFVIAAGVFYLWAESGRLIEGANVVLDTEHDDLMAVADAVQHQHTDDGFCRCGCDCDVCMGVIADRARERIRRALIAEADLRQIEATAALPTYNPEGQR